VSARESKREHNLRLQREIKREGNKRSIGMMPDLPGGIGKAVATAVAKRKVLKEAIKDIPLRDAAVKLNVKPRPGQTLARAARELNIKPARTAPKETRLSPRERREAAPYSKVPKGESGRFRPKEPGSLELSHARKMREEAAIAAMISLTASVCRTWVSGGARLASLVAILCAANVSASTPARPLAFGGTVPTQRATLSSCTTPVSSYPAGTMLRVVASWADSTRTPPITGRDSVTQAIGTAFSFSKNVPAGTYTVRAHAVDGIYRGCGSSMAIVIDTLAALASVPITPILNPDSPPPPPPPLCWTANLTWRSLAMPSQVGLFDMHFDLIPAAGMSNGVVGLSNAVATDYPQLAVIVRFAPSGFIDARNGSVYIDSPVRYVAGTVYHVRLAVDVVSRRFSAYVKVGASTTEQTIANNYAFRTDQAAVTSLAYLTLYGKVGTFQLCGWPQ